MPHTNQEKCAYENRDIFKNPCNPDFQPLTISFNRDVSAPLESVIYFRSPHKK